MMRFAARKSAQNCEFYAKIPASGSLTEAIQLWARGAFTGQKPLARSLKLTPVEARSVLEGLPSKATIGKVLRAAGWGACLTIMDSFLGLSLEDFIAQGIEESERQKETGDALLRDLRASWRQRDADDYGQADGEPVGAAVPPSGPRR